jgi:LmbE family N-acetylglucosaminyl deacetylase
MKYLLFLLLINLACYSQAQQQNQLSSSEIYQEILKLNTFGKVLYLAAHPDDENTRFIAYCANEKNMQTAYMSLTRGDGGQNLVGPELREELGLIRTQELLMARSVDGGQQFFSRANDFGYSKNPEETFEIWDKKKVLGDLVYVIRFFQPDIIVCRFPADGGGGHGHHTASAILGEEAFELAADKNSYPEQLNEVKIWQAQRIVTNTGRWWNNDISADDDNVVVEDVGAFSPLQGISCNEIAAHSRTMHKSQGFGSTGSRGQQLEYFEHVKGTLAKESLFEGVQNSWGQYTNGKKIEKLIGEILNGYSIQNPSLTIPKLVAVRTLLLNENKPELNLKIKKIEDLIIQSAGIYLDATSNKLFATDADSVDFEIEFISRLYANVKLKSVKNEALGFNWKPEESVAKNIDQTHKAKLKIQNLDYSIPYWLKNQATLGTYNLDEQSLVAQPINTPSVMFDAVIEIEGIEIKRTFPMVFSKNDPVKGEQRQPFYIVPKVSVSSDLETLLAKSGENQTITIKVKSFGEKVKGSVIIQTPKGWGMDTFNENLAFDFSGQEKEINIVLKPTSMAESGDVKLIFKDDENKSYSSQVKFIEYDHIPTQLLLTPSRIKLNLVDLKIKGKLVGYVEGAGDEIPKALRLMGYEVKTLTEEDCKDLSSYDAVVLGIRALNTNERIEFMLPALFEFVKNGGNMIVQYNTSHRLQTKDIAPYSLKLSRDRVTNEDAKMKFIAPNHPVLNSPNVITQTDFEGWVQERGLYFPGEWAEEFVPVFECNDQGETPKTGSLLIAPYGKGNYIYTGISFFRELPVGVPGAYRLFANLISLQNGK